MSANSERRECFDVIKEYMATDTTGMSGHFKGGMLSSRRKGYQTTE